MQRTIYGKYGKKVMLFSLLVTALVATGCGSAGGGSEVSSPAWNSTTLVDGTAGYTTLGMELDSFGNTHILYSRKADNELIYLRETASGWSSDSSGKNGRTADFFLSAAGKPHLIYSEGDGSGDWTLRHASSNDGISWIEGDIVTDGNIFNAAADIDSSDTVHTAYQYASYDLAYASGTHAVWNTGDVDTSISDIDIRIETVVDQNDEVHILYMDYGESPYTLKMVSEPQTPGETVHTIDDSGGSDDAYSLAVDDAGRIHVAYSWYLSGDSELRYAVYDSAWSIETVSTNIDSGNSPSIAVDSEGTVHIAYTDGTDRQLYYARHEGAWSVTRVPTGAVLVDNPVLRLDGAERPMIAYLDSDENSLKLAVRSE